MIFVKQATVNNASELANLARITYIESHAHFINDNRDLQKYVQDSFTVEQTLVELNEAHNLFYIAYKEEVAIGYIKLDSQAKHESIPSHKSCRLERIYVLSEYIPLKIGRNLLDFAVNQARILQLDTLWLTVYVKNHRAIRFYQKNEFTEVGRMEFRVNTTDYENFVYSKSLQL